MQHAADRNSECQAELDVPELKRLQQQLVEVTSERSTLDDVKSWMRATANTVAATISDFASALPVLESPSSPIREGGHSVQNRVRARLNRANRRGRERVMLRVQLASLEVQLSQNEMMNAWINEDEKKIRDDDHRTRDQRAQDRQHGRDYWHRALELRRNRLRVDANQLTTVIDSIHGMLDQIEREESADSI